MNSWYQCWADTDIYICLGECGEAPKTKRRNWNNPSKDTNWLHSERQGADWRDLRVGGGDPGLVRRKLRDFPIRQSGLSQAHDLTCYYLVCHLSFVSPPSSPPFFELITKITPTPSRKKHPGLVRYSPSVSTSEQRIGRLRDRNLSYYPQYLLSEDWPGHLSDSFPKFRDMLGCFRRLSRNGDRNSFRTYRKTVRLH